MKIILNTKTVFRCPTVLLANNITAGLISAGTKRKRIYLTRKQIMLFVKELKSFKKRHPDWNPVEITQKNGDTVIIEI